MKNTTNSVLIQSVSLEELASFISNTIETKLETVKHPTKKPLEYLTRKETAELLRISLPTLNELTKKGTLQGYRISSRVLYKRDEIEDSLTEIETLKYRRA
jgi:excisionase family DNA binding protein